MPPPRPSKKSSSVNVKSRFFEGSSSKTPFSHRPETSSSGNTSNGISGSSFRNRGYSNSHSHAGNRNNLSSNSRNRGYSTPHTSNSSNLSSNSEARKPRRKRRPKKKKEQVHIFLVFHRYIFFLVFYESCSSLSRDEVWYLFFFMEKFVEDRIFQNIVMLHRFYFFFLFLFL